jgi:HAE1 family hydrophobic/amphiphilic exporter-1/multidrug efflux pump
MRETARQRFRPILMPSMAFYLGVLPLVLSTGAGEADRNQKYGRLKHREKSIAA